jgi:hypothetical protein
VGTAVDDGNLWIVELGAGGAKRGVDGNNGALKAASAKRPRPKRDGACHGSLLIPGIVVVFPLKDTDFGDVIDVN